jgi:AcrR family transcriptional regulator
MSSLRRDQATAVRERILKAAIEVIEQAEEPNMRTVARSAGVSERTVYRYFASREELHAALTPEIRARASAPMPDDVDGLDDYVRTLYTNFARNAFLTRALSTAAWMPTRETRPANLRALREIIDRAFPKAPKRDRESAAASLRVPLSAAGWAYFADCGFDLEASIAHAQWATRTVLEKLQRLARHGHARR